MCAENQLISHTQHFLVSAYGRHWKEVNLAVFTIYVDDSGTDPKQKVAIAAALIVPAKQIERIQAIWDSFRNKYGFDYLHAAEIATPRRKGQYERWSDAQVDSALSRARRITMQYASAAYAFAVKKSDFDRNTPQQWRTEGGQNHFTWAFRTLLDNLIRWRIQRKVNAPFEWIFDNADGRDRDEIEMLMAQFEYLHPGHFDGHYSFRCKANVPCLQASDLLAWSTYSVVRAIYGGVPASPFALKSMQEFRAHQQGEWLQCLTFDQGALKKAVAEDSRNPEASRTREEWYKKWRSTLPVRKSSRPQREKCPC